MIQTNVKCLAATNELIYLPAIEMAIEQNGGKLVGVQSKTNPMSLDRALVKTKSEVLIVTVEYSKDKDTASPNYQLIEQIQKEHPLVRIIVIAKEAKDILRLIETEVKGFVLVNEHFNELTRAIKMVTQGENYYSPKVSQTMARKIKNKQVSLTSREMEVFTLSKEDKSTAQIAQILKLKPSTIRTHLTNARFKLKANLVV